jgi:hypothetical protein
MNDRPTDVEIQQTADILRRLPRGFLPLDIFRVLAERLVLPCLELAILRVNQRNEIEVLLTQRDADDPYWPSGWHLPGGVLLATDNEGDYSSIFGRIFQGELNDEYEPLQEPQFVTTRFHETNRGREIVQEYFTEVAYQDIPTVVGKFFPADKLPEETLKQYYQIIPLVVQAFQLQKDK